MLAGLDARRSRVVAARIPAAAAARSAAHVAGALLGVLALLAGEAPAVIATAFALPLLGALPLPVAAVAYVATAAIESAFVTTPMAVVAGFGFWVRDLALVALVLRAGVSRASDADRGLGASPPRASRVMWCTFALVAGSPLLTWGTLGGEAGLGSVGASLRLALDPLAALVIAHTLRNDRDRAWTVRAVAVLGVCLAVTVILDVGASARAGGLGAVDDRPGGLVGDPELAARLALVAWCLHLGLAFSATTRAALAAHVACTLVCFGAIVVTRTRAAFFALLVGAVCVAFDRAFFRARQRLRGVVTLSALALAGVLLFGMLGPPLLRRIENATPDSLGRRDESTELRVTGWHVAWDAATETSYLGVGWGGLDRYVLLPEVVARHGAHGHRYVRMVTGTAVHLVGAFGLFAPFLYFAWLKGFLSTTRRPRGDPEGDAVRLGGRALLYVFAVGFQGALWFVAGSAVSTCVWIVLGVVVSGSSPASPEQPHDRGRERQS